MRIPTDTTRRWTARPLARVAAAAILGIAAGCAVPPPAATGSSPPAAGAGAPASAEARPAAPSAPEPAPSHPTPRGRWVAADWSALPGWDADTTVMAWPALLRGCQRPAAGWAATCDAARAMVTPDEAQVRRFLEQRLRPWRVEAADGRAEGLITGYFEPLVEATRQRSARHAVPLYAPPADLAGRRPWFSRAEIDQSPAARAALRGREIAWVADPLDALLLQIQGSGRLLIDEGGTRRTVRVAYAGHNDHPYRSVGRWLVEQGAFTLEQANWPAIKAWARANPRRVTEMLQANPRFIFFREEALPDPSIGPVGAQGVPLTPGRSIAVDRESVPYGTPVWLDTTEPQPWQPDPPPARPLRRLVLAQDTGSAITGAVRADYFWGWGDGAEDRAGRMKQALRLWVLWPRDAPLPGWPAPAAR